MALLVLCGAGGPAAAACRLSAWGASRSSVGRSAPVRASDLVSAAEQQAGAEQVVYLPVVSPPGPGDYLSRLDAEGVRDQSFHAPLWAPGQVVAIAVRPDGRVLVAGMLRAPGGRATALMALTADGNPDAAFQSPLAGSATSLAVAPDGRVLVGGDLAVEPGGRSLAVARLMPEGALDPSFAAGAGPNGRVQALAVQADGRVVIGGTFTEVAGVTRPGIARLLADGSLDPAFEPALSPPGSVRALALEPDGRILVGGQLGADGGPPWPLARLQPDGSSDSAFNAAVPEGEATCLAVQADGRIVVSGLLDSGGQSAPANVARLNPDGTLDPSFAPYRFLYSFYYGTWVDVVLLEPGGTILAGGGLSGPYPISTEERFVLARLSGGGQEQARFEGAFPPASAVTSVEALALDAGGGVFVGGSTRRR